MQDKLLEPPREINATPLGKAPNNPLKGCEVETSTPGTDLLQCWDEVRVREDEEEILYIDPAHTHEVPRKVTR